MSDISCEVFTRQLIGDYLESFLKIVD